MGAARRYMARDEMEPRGLKEGDDPNGFEAALRKILSEDLGILDDDIEKVMSKAKGASAEDDAPANMGSGGVSGELTGGREDAGGGSTRTYAPTDGGGYGNVAGGAMDRRLRPRAADASGFFERFPDAAKVRVL